jgi:hypothetical protein
MWQGGEGDLVIPVPLGRQALTKVTGLFRYQLVLVDGVPQVRIEPHRDVGAQALQDLGGLDHALLGNVQRSGGNTRSCRLPAGRDRQSRGGSIPPSSPGCPGPSRRVRGRAPWRRRHGPGVARRGTPVESDGALGRDQDRSGDPLPGKANAGSVSSMRARRGSSHGGSFRWVPSSASDSSRRKPGGSVAISKSTPPGSRK